MNHQQHHSGVLDWFSQNDFMPHGHCYLWKPGLVWTHVISDFLIGAAYVGISITLWALIKKIKIQFNQIVFSFGVFILACGLTHFMEIWNLWQADYWAAAWVKIITAVASVATGFYLYKLRHPIITVAEAAKLSEQRRMDLESLTQELEHRVDFRTKELKQSEERFRTLLEAMPQMAWITDARGIPRYFNEQWYSFTNSSRETSLSEQWISFIHPEDRDRVLSDWMKCVGTGDTYNIEYRMRKSDGTMHWFLSRGVPMRDLNGNIVEWVGTNTYINEQKEIQKELSETITARDQFLSIASHELKTPLTSLILQSQFMEHKMSSRGEIALDETKKFLGVIKRQGNRLNRLVNDMLDVSRIQAGKLELKIEKHEICSFVKNIIDGFKSQSDQYHQTIELAESNSQEVYFDDLRLEQVFNNLFTNAIKYAPGSRVDVRIFGEEQYVRIEVQDYGPGIKPQNLDIIFTRFERATSSDEVSGLGLGLYISRQIVEAHKGRIWAESELGKGTTFIIRLPRFLQE